MSAQGQAAYLSLISMSAAQQMGMISSRGLQTHRFQNHLSSLLSMQAHSCKQEAPAGRPLWVSIHLSACFVCSGSAVSRPTQLSRRCKPSHMSCVCPTRWRSTREVCVTRRRRAHAGPDFMALARKHPDLARHVRPNRQGRGVIDFTDFEAARSVMRMHALLCSPCSFTARHLSHDAS